MQAIDLDYNQIYIFFFKKMGPWFEEVRFVSHWFIPKILEILAYWANKSWL